MAFKFIPADWVLSDDLRQWTRSKGLTDECIAINPLLCGQLRPQ